MDNQKNLAVGSESYDVYTAYIRDISKFPLLNKMEEKKLGRLAMKGNKKAIETLVNCNLRLVVKYAHEFTGCGLGLMDLISEGNRGLIKAAGRFDPKRSKFSTYATYWIKQFIRRAIENQGNEIRLPSHVIAALSKIRKFAKAYEEKYKSKPSAEEIAKSTKLPISKIKRLSRDIARCVSYNEKVGEDGAEMGDFLRDEKVVDPAQAAEANSNHEMLFRLMKEVLNEKEREILTLRYGLQRDNENMTLEEVGTHFDVTRERIRQIQHEALDKLRQHKDALTIL